MFCLRSKNSGMAWSNSVNVRSLIELLTLKSSIFKLVFHSDSHCQLNNLEFQ